MALASSDLGTPLAKRVMISVESALGIVLDTVKPLAAEQVALEFALGRVLAEDIRADIDLPPFDRARMDGYALRSLDAAVAPSRLRIIGEVAAGATFSGNVGSGEAVKIFTGAPMPLGADAVQMIEVTERAGDWVVIKEPAPPGHFVTTRASEVQARQVVAGAGREIGAPEMAVLASFGYSTILVGRRPRVTVLSTGSELIEVARTPSGAQIRNSNSYTIASYAAECGARVEMGGIVKDTPEATREALLRAASMSDVIVTSGGVSVGDYDLVKAALLELDAQVLFDQVSIRPGKPTVFARLGETYFFGLPGNPVSTSVTFNVFVRPALRQMMGDRLPSLPVVAAIAARTIEDGSNRMSYLPARFFVSEGQAMAEPLKWAGSADLVAFMEANALIIIPEQIHEIGKGQLVTTMLLSSGASYGTDSH
jgi:molybdopterin molybdotransferase